MATLPRRSAGASDMGGAVYGARAPRGFRIHMQGKRPKRPLQPHVPSDLQHVEPKELEQLGQLDVQFMPPAAPPPPPVLVLPPLPPVLVVPPAPAGPNPPVAGAPPNGKPPLPSEPPAPSDPSPTGTAPSPTRVNTGRSSDVAQPEAKRRTAAGQMSSACGLRLRNTTASIIAAARRMGRFRAHIALCARPAAGRRSVRADRRRSCRRSARDWRTANWAERRESVPRRRETLRVAPPRRAQ